MQIIKKDVAKGIVQITTPDSRWYVKTENKVDKFVPSVTWITNYYPKGTPYYKWLAEHGWDESEAIKIEAGQKGSLIHLAIADLISGKTVKMDDKYIVDGIEREIGVFEWEAIMSFVEWTQENKPEFINSEMVIFSDKHNFAGTVDLICKIGDETWLIDLKTSQYVWPSHKLQISAYKQAVEQKIDKLGILQVGYTKNKFKKYKMNEIDDCFDLFLSAQNIWKAENDGVSPKQYEFPIELSLTKEDKKDANRPKK